MCKGLHFPLTWSNVFCGGRGKRGALVEKCRGPWPKNVVMIKKKYGEEKMKTREDKTMVKL